MRNKVLQQLHQSHMGIEKTKWRAKVTIFWLEINQQIENMVKKCSNCQQNQRKQQHEPMKTSNVPQYPFQMDQIYLNRMVKILYWWLITTVDIGTLRTLQNRFCDSYEEVKTLSFQEWEYQK